MTEISGWLLTPSLHDVSTIHWISHRYIRIILACFFVFYRDDLYRVELDNSAGDEMFYSKVRPTLTTKHALMIDNIHMSVTSTFGLWLVPLAETDLGIQQEWHSSVPDEGQTWGTGLNTQRSDLTFWDPLSHATTLSILSHAWAHTTAVRGTLFPAGAPACRIYTNLILLIQKQSIT